jgi:hypothetical protein
MFNEYERGLLTLMYYVTEIKFDVFMKIALSLGADLLLLVIIAENRNRGQQKQFTN